MLILPRYAICAALIAAGALVIAANTSSANEQLGPRETFQPPKLFDFARFKDVFQKSYGSITEELIRQKLFLARAFRAFMSHIKYRHQMTSYYLRVNHMSDWTREEGNSVLINKDVKGTAQEPEPLVDENDVARELDEIRKRANEDGFKEIADDLRPTSNRRRRSATSSRRDLKLSDLDLVPEDGEEPPEVAAKIRPMIPSTNPERETPELFSYGDEAEEGEGEKLHGDEFFEKVTENDQQQFDIVSSIGNLASNLAKSLLGSNQQDQKQPSEPTEYYVDHRESNCFFTPRSQGRCGSCYSFAYTALLEYLHCKATGNLTAFSEQYAIDCGYRQHERLEGCDGAPMPLAARFFVNFGMELRSTYPYIKKRNKCPYPDSIGPFRMGYLKPNFKHYYIPIDRLSLEEDLRFTPMVIGIGTVHTDFQEYGGGVHDLGGCKTDKLDHAVVLVGHGREDGKDFWLIRNSYGANFGEGGYFKLDKKVGCIFEHAHAFGSVTKYAMFPVVNRDNDPDIMIEAGKKLQQKLDRKWFEFWV